MKHLTDEQLAAGWRAGWRVKKSSRRVRTWIAARNATPRRWNSAMASRATRCDAPAIVSRRERAHERKLAPRRALALHRLRWAGAGALALLLVAQTAWLVKPRHAPATALQRPAHLSVRRMRRNLPPS